MAKRISRELRRARVEQLEPRRLLSDVIAVGPEFRVNTYTTNWQDAPSVAMAADGHFVVAWRGPGVGDSDGVFAQRFSDTGVHAGAEFKVNTFTLGGQRFPSTAMAPYGDSVITWQSNGQDGSNDGIYAQRYNSAGVAQGAEFRVNTYTTGFQQAPAVAMDAAGNFVIVWQGPEIVAKRYNAAGQELAPPPGVPLGLGNEFRVNTYTAGNQGSTAISMDGAGNFVIAWSGAGPHDMSGVHAQLFNASGVPQGDQIGVNTHTTTGQLAPSVAMDADGEFVIAWSSYPGQDGEGYGVYAQRFSSAGVSQGGEFRVNTYTTDWQFGPSVAMDADGDFVISWTGNFQDGESYGVYAQRYGSAGVPQGSEFRVNTYTTGGQDDSSVAMHDDGDFVIVWDGEGASDAEGIYAQRYAVVPEVTASAFHFATPPHKLSFTFDRDVSGSLGTDDLVVQNLTTMQTIPSSDFSIDYDTLTNVATFAYTGTTAGITGMLP